MLQSCTPGKSTAKSLRTRESDQNAKAVSKYRQKVKQHYTALEEQRNADAQRLKEAEAELKRLSMQTRALQVLMDQGKNLTVSYSELVKNYIALYGAVHNWS